MDALPKRQLFLTHVAQTSSLPLLLDVDRAEGVYIYSKEGKKYFDLNSGISVSSLGHCHPAVVKAIGDQAKRYMHTMVYGEHLQGPQIEYAQLLFDQLDSSLNCIYYLSSGTEVVEASMKLAKRATGRYEFISAKQAYHGSSQGAEALRSDHDYSRAFLPLIPGVRHINYNSLEDLMKISTRTAAVILEPVQAEAGIRTPEPGYLEALRERCDETKTLLIFDEIQTGFGRTGKLFAHQKYGVIPDLMCIGKAMGGGIPIGGLVGPKSLLNLFTNAPALGHITTFGGHPVSCAAAVATLKTLIGSNLIEQVEEKERYIVNKLKHPIIKEIRSSGLMMAVELSKRKYLKHVVNGAFQKGALIDYFLFNSKSFRLAPPLIYSNAELEQALELLLEAMNEAQARYQS